MSQDKMFDVFPVRFDFKKGEMANEEKLSGVIKHIDIGFDNLTEVIGDPWDIQQHNWNSSIQKLSLENLGQPNLARIIGPSDWISPGGGDFSKSSSAILTLKANRSNWILGYPLVKISTSIMPNSSSSNLAPLSWGTDIAVTRDTDQVLATRKTSISGVIEDGDFYVDFYKGTIVSYKQTSSEIRLSISNLNRLASGIPWGTHNVIPTWNETTNLCNLVHVSTDESMSEYILNLPVVTTSPRTGSSGIEISGGSYTNWLPDVNWNSIPGATSNYTLPPSLTNQMSIGDEIPEGFILLWDEVLGRVTPGIISIKYRAVQSLAIETPPGWLNAGSNYRIITVGTSLSEAVSYLLTAQRYDTHTGVLNTAKLGYSIPLSHRDLEGRYTDDTGSSSSLVSPAFRFRESSYATNCHPQYLHRYGYMSSDLNGNSGNAMRGNIVFSGVETVDHEFPVGTTKTTSGNYTSTYGISFGSGTTTATRLRFDGGEGFTSWVDSGSTGPAKRFAFGLKEVGASPVNDRSEETYGALAISPWYGTPLYLRGQSSGPTNSEEHFGGVLGFDLGRNSELNYIKLVPGYRESATWHKKHLPARLNQSSYTAASINPCMPLLDYSICAEQVREFRFRGGAYIPTATNLNNSLGGSATRSDASAITELLGYYTSPGMVGADFFNCYGNAIFFSEGGSGQKTSFTDNSKTWLDSAFVTDPWTSFYATGQFNSSMPTGLYYHPYSSNTLHGHRFIFSLYDTALDSFTQPLNFGDRTGFEYASNLGGNIRFSTRIEDGQTEGGGILLIAGATRKTAMDDILLSDISSYTNKIQLWADDDITIRTSTDLYLIATEEISCTSSLNFDIHASTSFNVTAPITTITSSTSITIDSPTLFFEDVDTRLKNGNTTYSFVDITSSNARIGYNNTGVYRSVVNCSNIGVEISVGTGADIRFTGLTVNTGTLMLLNGVLYCNP